MYQCGDQLAYGVHGVCTVLQLETRTIDKKSVEYYVLAPVDQPSARFYVPTQNASAVAKLHPLLSRRELEALLRSANTVSDAWIADDNQRKQRYRELLGMGDRAELLRMIHTLLRKKEELLAAGKKFHQSDEGFLRDAKKLLSSEICHVMHIKQDEVDAYISGLILSK